MPDDITIRHDLRVGDLGRIISLHGEVYEALPGFGLTFEAFVARTIADYILDTGGQGRIWLAEKNDKLVGCAAMVLRDEERGQLRWVLVDQSARGIGLGKDLVNRTLHYARDNRCSRVFLETTDGLSESQSLYDALGFEVVSDVREELWDGVRPLIRMEMTLK
jgi:GNAT superfamily N-acetyltransferase